MGPLSWEYKKWQPLLLILNLQNSLHYCMGVPTPKRAPKVEIEAESATFALLIFHAAVCTTTCTITYITPQAVLALKSNDTHCTGYTDSQLQFKMLFIIFKSLHGQDQIICRTTSPWVSAHLSRLNKAGPLQVTAFKCCLLERTGECLFHFNPYPMEFQQAPILLTFWEVLKSQVPSPTHPQMIGMP